MSKKTIMLLTLAVIAAIASAVALSMWVMQGVIGALPMADRETPGWLIAWMIMALVVGLIILVAIFGIAFTARSRKPRS